MWNYYRARFGGKRGWLRPIIVDTLKESPKNGAEIMESFEKLSMGWWKPSPGSIYPALSEMVSEGIVKKREDGRYVLLNLEEESDFPQMMSHSKNSPSDVLAEVESDLMYIQDVASSGRLSVEDEQLISRLTAMLQEILRKKEK